MKIIDLLNKIANGEEVPANIKYNGIDYYWCNSCKIYERIEDGRNDLYNDIDNLNDKVEILEEEKKIPEKLTDILRVDDLIPPVDENMYKIWQQTIKNQNKINEICDYLKSKGE